MFDFYQIFLESVYRKKYSKISIDIMIYDKKIWPRPGIESCHIQPIKVCDCISRCAKILTQDMSQISRKIFFAAKNEQRHNNWIVDWLRLTLICYTDTHWAHTTLHLSQRLISKNGFIASVMDFSFPLIILVTRILHFRLFFSDVFLLLAKICVSFERNERTK